MTDPICQKNYTQNRLFDRKKSTQKIQTKENSYLFQHKIKSEIKFGHEENQIFNRKKRVECKQSQESNLFQSKERVQGPISNDQEMFQHKQRVQGPESKYQKQWEEKRKFQQTERKQPYSWHKTYHQVQKSDEIVWYKPKGDGFCKNVNKPEFNTFPLFQVDTQPSTCLNSDRTYENNKQPKQYIQEKRVTQMGEILQQEPQELQSYRKVQQKDQMKAILSYDFSAPFKNKDISKKCTQTSIDFSHYNYNSNNQQDYRIRCLISERFQ